MAALQSRQDALQARIAGLSLAGQGWLGAARTEALARLTAMGLPGKRDEYWRYTDPGALNAAEAAGQPVRSRRRTAPFSGVDRLKIVFVDGVFDASQSDALALTG